MALKKINIDLYYKDHRDLMQQLYDVHLKVSKGYFIYETKTWSMQNLYAQEIPFKVETIDGVQFRKYIFSLPAF